MSSIDFAAEIASELKFPAPSVTNTIALLRDDATIPFIARYRKEVTGSLDEVQLRQIRDRLDYLTKLAERQAVVLKSIEEQGKLTDELREQIEQTRDAARLEDLYLPFRPKRKTRATQARAKGLEPLADLIWAQQPLDGDPNALVAQFVDVGKDVPDADAAWQGARDIVAERISENPELRAALRGLFLTTGQIESHVKKGHEKSGGKFRDYFSFQEKAARIPSHRMLAIRRGEAEGHLTYRITVDLERASALVHQHTVKGDGGPLAEHLLAACEDSYDRLLSLSIEGQARNALRERADQEAIGVFATNLRRLLMTAPLGSRWVMGVDPGVRTGCKIVALDGKGDLLASTVIHLSKGEQQAKEAEQTVERYCQHYRVEAIAVGNGTGGRETETFLRKLGRDALNDAVVVMVSEAGASVYSASDLARQELPDLDVTIRGAVSIGRRLQDPLAELVKIDPKAIGVGQYQHDVDLNKLKDSLDETVQSCVNQVGVDLNTASPQLLQYVAGLGPSQAKSVIDFRSKKGRFHSRAELLTVPKIGPKTFEQAAGFLRIRNAANPLDGSAVHPERYALVEQMARDANTDVATLTSDAGARKAIDLEKYVSDDVGLPTLKDILAELAQPGRDPREGFDPVQFDPEVTEIGDLNEGKVLAGVVTNVTAFGAFVDIGVHQDGLVHLSELAWRYIEDASQVVAVGDKVSVKVLGIDRERKRISLSIKQTTEAPPRPEPVRREPRPEPRPARPPERRPERRPEPQKRRGQNQGDRRPERPGRTDRPAQQAKPKFDSPFSVLFMENGVVKLKDDDKKAKKKK